MRESRSAEAKSELIATINSMPNAEEQAMRRVMQRVLGDSLARNDLLDAVTRGTPEHAINVVAELRMNYQESLRVLGSVETGGATIAYYVLSDVARQFRHCHGASSAGNRVPMPGTPGFIAWAEGPYFTGIISRVVGTDESAEHLARCYAGHLAMQAIRTRAGDP